MGLLDGFRKRRGRQRPGVTRAATSADEEHLRAFVSSRRGVEAFIEPQTNFTPATLLLVAFDGEWTRRRVPSEDWGVAFARKLEMPCYDAGIVGIPNRMREYNKRQKEQG